MKTKKLCLRGCFCTFSIQCLSHFFPLKRICRFYIPIKLVFHTFFSRFSDCEVNDVNELAKDEQLVDKLYAETLRALKLDDIKVV